jgi:hypothetical protein
MTAETHLFVLTARLRRAQPRNADVLELCDRAEELARERAASLSANAANAPSVANSVAVGAANVANRPKRDRVEYMRTYMRRRRAKDADTHP